MSTPGSETPLELLRFQVREALSRYLAPEIRVEMTRLLGRPGFALHPEGACRAGLLAVSVHAAVDREAPVRSSLASAAAVELQMEAAYLFDQVADSAPYAEHGEDLAMAIALLMAGAAAASDAAARPAAADGTLRRACRAYGEAAAGQYLDALHQRRGSVTLDQALQSTCLKAGGLGRFAAGFAARVAGADAGGVALFERFGFDTFTLAQLLDDLRDADAPGEDSDLAQRKATLPVVFYGRGAERASSEDGILTRHPYALSGASLYVSILALAYLNRAREDLSQLAQQGYAVEGLIRYLESVDAGAAEALASARDALVA